MKSFISLVVAGVFLNTAHAVPEWAVYGDDSRTDVRESQDPLHQGLSLSTAALISHSQLRVQGNKILIEAPTMKERINVCEGEPFADQPSASNCSGTLIAPDVILTAGHCYMDARPCAEQSWVFDYRLGEGLEGKEVPASSVYRCKEIIHQKLDLNERVDYALIRLERPVHDRSPVTLSTEELTPGIPLVLIGTPQGLPTKIAGDGEILRVQGTSLIANVDSFRFNSGAGIFHAVSGELVGVLSGGASDYQQEGDCVKNRVYAMDKGRERATTLGPIKAILEIRN